MTVAGRDDLAVYDAVGEGADRDTRGACAPQTGNGVRRNWSNSTNKGMKIYVARLRVMVYLVPGVKRSLKSTAPRGGSEPPAKLFGGGEAGKKPARKPPGQTQSNL